MKKFHVPRYVTLSKSSLEAIERLERGEYIEYSLEEFINEFVMPPVCQAAFKRVF